MSPALLSLVGFGAWTLLLTGCIVARRTFLTLSGQRAANSFSPSGEDISPFTARLSRAHANCYENLPIFGAFVVGIHLLGFTVITQGLAPWFLAARVAQSTVHLASTSPAAVIVRFGFFGVQVGIQLLWLIRLGQRMAS